MKRSSFLFALLFLMHFYIQINNCEAQWQPDVRLTNNPASSFTSGRSVASSGSIIHVVWTDDRDGNREIYYKRSTDAGITWGTDTRLTNAIGFSFYASIAVSGSVVHIVWHDERNWLPDIYYKCSTDAGVSWGADILIAGDLYYSIIPSVAVSGSVVHIVWMDDRDGNGEIYEIYYKRSMDAGVSWGEVTRLTNSISDSWYPSVAVSGSVVHVVWYEWSNEQTLEIYYKRSSDAGVNWGADTRLTYDTAWSQVPSVAASGSVVHVVWYDQRDGNKEIYYKRSTDAGVNWGADTRLTNNTANSWTPSVEVSGSVVHVVWMDERDGNPEIYYKRSTDAGISWEADTRLTNETAWSQAPSVAVSSSNVHVVWTDNRNGNAGEIYYKRNPTGNPIGIQNIGTETPSSYSLGQNYPNPFNSSSKFKFQISRHGGSSTGNVKIVVYDIMGREVQTLVNERLQPGTYETSFDGSMLNNGVYFYKMVTEGFTETKRMILIK